VGRAPPQADLSQAHFRIVQAADAIAFAAFSLVLLAKAPESGLPNRSQSFTQTRNRILR
jgi:hypothetical protein